MKSTGEILVVGGGVISLAIALALKRQGASVTIVSRDFTEAATHAAAGMLAPQAERIPPSPMLDLCLRSRDLYADWTQKLEELTGLNPGYWACGILAPAYQEDDINHQNSESVRLDRAAIHQRQPGLGSEVVGGWWFPQDAQVDNRSLAKTLWVAVQELGVEIRTGITVEKIVQNGDRVSHLQTSAGDWQADHYILATGAWSQSLLPIPVTPKKGQMLSVQMMPDSMPLKTVLYGLDSYIVPRQDGRIIIGATSEEVEFTPGNTPRGVQSLLSAAIRLYPALQDYPIQECWWGFRPATPDELPILGTSPYRNLTLATGHYRNGILLAPITGALIAEWVLHQKADPLLDSFHWSRFMA